MFSDFFVSTIIWILLQQFANIKMDQFDLTDPVTVGSYPKYC